MRFKHKIILASGSPRRRELIGYLFENNEVLKYPCEEPVWSFPQSPEQYLRQCLQVKWSAAQKALREPRDAWMLVADTIVVQGAEVLGKPLSAAHARQTLARLSGSSHLVRTGFLLGRADSRDVPLERVEESRVHFRKLSLQEIADYVRSGEPMDKAGAYGFQGIGIQNILSIEGSYTNIVGLPLEALRKAAEVVGVQ